MSRSFFAKLHRRFGTRLSGAERYERANAKQIEFVNWLKSAFPSDCARALPNGVAIVGGGFAGFAAAWTLGQAGVASVVLEARHKSGGRVESDRNFIPGRVIERGAELIGLNHPMWLALAKHFGLGLAVITGEDQYAGAGLEMPLLIGGMAVPDPEKLYRQMGTVFQRISSDAKAIADPFAPWTARGASALDAKSVSEKLAEFVGLLPKSTRHPLLAEALEFQLGNDNVLPTKEQSYLGLLALVSGGRMGKSDVHLDGYWNDTEEFRCAEGNDVLPGMMLEFGKRAVLQTSNPVTKIEINETDSVAKVTWDSQGEKSKIFDYVILTAPPNVWKKITIVPALPAGREMGSGPAVKYISQVDDRFWIKKGKAPSGMSDQLGQTWEATENQALTSQGIALSAFAGGAFVPTSDAEKRFSMQLLKLYPGYTARATRYVDWRNVTWIETGYSCPKVSQVTTIGKFLSVPYRQRLYFAGEHTCMAYFGYMEGALQSGARVAKAILASCLKKPSKGFSRKQIAQDTPPSAGEAVVMDLRSQNRFLDRADCPLSGASSGRHQSETSFLRGLLRELATGAPVADLSPAELFRASLSDESPISNARDLLRVLGRPSQRPDDALRPGDWLIRAVPGTGDVGHVSVLTSGDLLTPSALASEGIAAESTRPGYYGLVIESGAFPHRRSRPFARRVLDSRGRVPPHTLVLRPHCPNSGPLTDSPLEEPEPDVGRAVDVQETSPELDVALSDLRTALDTPAPHNSTIRRDAVVEVIRRLSSQTAARLSAALQDTTHPIRRKMSRALHHASIPRILALLKNQGNVQPSKVEAPSGPAEPPQKSPCVRELGTVTTLLPWERSFLALVNQRDESDFKSVAILIGPIIIPGLMTNLHRIIVESALKQNNAITIESNVWFPRDIDTSDVPASASDPQSDLTWLVHESVHVLDYAMAGTEAFLKSYVQQGLIHRFKHDEIPHEKRANRVEFAATRLLLRFPELANAIKKCNAVAIMAELERQKDAYRSAVGELIGEEDEVAASEM